MEWGYLKFLDPPPLHFKNILHYGVGDLQNISDPTPYTLKIFYTTGWGSLKYFRPPPLAQIIKSHRKYF